MRKSGFLEGKRWKNPPKRHSQWFSHLPRPFPSRHMRDTLFYYRGSNYSVLVLITRKVDVPHPSVWKERSTELSIFMFTIWLPRVPECARAFASAELWTIDATQCQDAPLPAHSRFLPDIVDPASPLPHTFLILKHQCQIVGTGQCVWMSSKCVNDCQRRQQLTAGIC
jgi:hypothetical protein